MKYITLFYFMMYSVRVNTRSFCVYTNINFIQSSNRDHCSIARAESRMVEGHTVGRFTLLVDPLASGGILSVREDKRLQHDGAVIESGSPDATSSNSSRYVYFIKCTLNSRNL